MLLAADHFSKSFKVCVFGFVFCLFLFLFFIYVYIMFLCDCECALLCPSRDQRTTNRNYFSSSALLNSSHEAQQTVTSCSITTPICLHVKFTAETMSTITYIHQIILEGKRIFFNFDFFELITFIPRVSIFTRKWQFRNDF